MDIEPDTIGKYFHEFGELGAECLFSPCSHDHEPGCKIKLLVDEGVISEGRYVSYLNILSSVKEHKARIY
jgi:ribosome biogenesis GTPase